MKKAFTLIELMIVTAIIAMLAAMSIPSLLRARMTANETRARTALKALSGAMETYAANGAGYPTSEDLLTDANPPYISQTYCDQAVSGYIYNCRLTASTYAVTASPVDCENTGSKNFAISTGGEIITALRCSDAAAQEPGAVVGTDPPAAVPGP